MVRPADRVIDGVDQLDWLTGQARSSKRDGYVYWMGRETYGAKWPDFKLVLVEQRYLSDSARPLPTPRLINLITDPQEREPIALPHLHTWVAHHVNRIIGEFEASVRREPLIPAGAPSTTCHGPHKLSPAVLGRHRNKRREFIVAVPTRSNPAVSIKSGTASALDEPPSAVSVNSRGNPGMSREKSFARSTECRGGHGQRGFDAHSKLDNIVEVQRI